MWKLFARLALAKKAWDWYTSYKRKKNASNQSGGTFDKNASNQSGGSIDNHRLGD